MAPLNEQIKPYVEAVNELAEAFAAHAVVPLHQAFERAHAARPDVDWATDGVRAGRYRRFAGDLLPSA